MTEIPRHLMEGVYVPRSDSTYACMVVLRDLGGDRYERFVVHDYVMPDNGNPTYYVSGDYFQDLEAAVARFRERDAREQRRLAART